MKLWNDLKEAMLKHPDQKICEGKAEMTYEETVIFAEFFSKNLSKEKCCAILCGSEMAASLALLSCFAAEVTALPLSFRYGKQHCCKILDTVSPTAIITDVNGRLEVVRMTAPTYREPPVSPALIMCTSGTTGRPKGAMLSEHNILTNVADICNYLKAEVTDSILIARPLYHCAVLTGEFLTSLFKGVKIRFYSGQFNPKILLDLINEHSITVFCGTPTLLGMMARFKRRNDLSPLKTICISGECMNAETGTRIAKAFPDAEIYHVYGLTEACPRVSYLPPHLFAEHADSVGVPLNSVTLKIVKTNGDLAQNGEEGILWVRGDNVMMGYYNAPTQTEEVLKDAWLYTGDIAVIDEYSLLKIKGRSDDLIIRAGMNIYPQEIEGALKSDARVKDVLAYKIEDSYTGTQIGLKISGDFCSVDEVKHLCAEVLPSFQVPTVIEILEELPRNGSGKIIRRGSYA